MGADVSFSKRFENIMKITKRLAEQGQDSSQAKAAAQQIEEQFLNVADTADEYQELCDDYVDVHQAISNPNAFDLESESLPDEIFNTEGPTLGNYEWATFHADGVTSTIYKAKSKDAAAEEAIVALKVISTDQLRPPHSSQKEIRSLQKAKSDHVVPLIEYFQQPGGRLVLVFPFLRQDLENLLRSGNLTKTQSSMVFQGLFGALAYLHSLGIIHRDIKPSNILLKSIEGPVYLIDFGIVWSEGDHDSEPANGKITDVGTTCYRPPEILFGDRSYDASLDMWAAGCVVAEMVSKDHQQLFDAGPVGSELGLIKSMFSTLGTPTDADWPSAAARYPDWGKVKFQEFPAKNWKDVLPGASKIAVNFVQSTVCYESTKRLNAEQALRHALAEQLKMT